MKSKLTRHVLKLPAIRRRQGRPAWRFANLIRLNCPDFRLNISAISERAVYYISKSLRNSSLHPQKNGFPATERFFPLRAIWRNARKLIGHFDSASAAATASYSVTAVDLPDKVLSRNSRIVEANEISAFTAHSLSTFLLTCSTQK